eukprot:TRINITY_DN1799_c0_g1_i1.p1 TRINITY_DN1799_c0_g1~~TRINITY_DN1799_c0_g1_i1.p1  ORF type:complete len:352 (-),score=67.93 TRINITY_DN1799_c0_g1_i1:115-1170(-)
MGLCGSSLTPEEKKAKKRNDEIDKDLGRARRIQKDQVKLLLLGTGESGKSTIFKQMKIISAMGGFAPEELAAYRYVIYGNCITQMKVLVTASKRHHPVGEANQKAVERFSIMSADPEAWSPDVANDVEALWADPAIKQTYAMRDKAFQLNDSAAYFFDNIGRLRPAEYVPNVQDALRARLRSTGIEEAEFEFEDIQFRMVDVGGQRSERRKWIHCFEGVTAIIFCAALSEYDQTLREDDTTNRMKESLMLFEEITNSPWFETTAFILFLNKLDLFKEKITSVDLKVTFPEYKGGKNEEAGKAFIKQMYLGSNHTAKTVYTHFTIAIDTKNIEVVFKCVRETLLQQILNDIF